MRKRAAGLTLLELMIAGVIVAILASLAIPSYSRYVLRSNRAVARNVLVQLAAKEEVIKLQTQAYAAASFGLLNGIDAANVYLDRNGTISATAGATSIYKISLASSPVSSTTCGTSTATADFQLIATPVAGGPQARDASYCASLCLSSTGLRGSTPNDVGYCWGQ